MTTQRLRSDSVLRFKTLGRMTSATAVALTLTACGGGGGGGGGASGASGEGNEREGSVVVGKSVSIRMEEAA